MLIVVEEIHSEQGSPQANLGSTAMREGNSGSKAKMQLIQRILAVWSDCWSMKDHMEQRDVPAKSTLDKPAAVDTPAVW